MTELESESLELLDLDPLAGDEGLMATVLAGLIMSRRPKSLRLRPRQTQLGKNLASGVMSGDAADGTAAERRRAAAIDTRRTRSLLPRARQAGCRRSRRRTRKERHGRCCRD